jgi:hypothetical protein
LGRSLAANDLSELVSAGWLVRIGGGRSTRYMLAHEPATQRRWTPDRIRRELETFCAGRNTWPTASEFKNAGRGDLYVAASRYGGVAHWANELGLERSDRSRAAGAVAREPRRGRLVWALAGVAAGLVLAAATATAVVATHDFGSTAKTGASASLEQQPAQGAVDEPLRPPRAAGNLAAANPRPHTHKRVTSGTARSAPGVRPTSQQRTELVSNVVAPSTVHTARSFETSLGNTAVHSNGPAPLPAPAGASAPSPLKAP